MLERPIPITPNCHSERSRPTVSSRSFPNEPSACAERNLSSHEIAAGTLHGRPSFNNNAQELLLPNAHHILALLVQLDSRRRIRHDLPVDFDGALLYEALAF